MRIFLALPAIAALALQTAPAAAETVTIRVETYAPGHAMNSHAWPEWFKAVEDVAPGMFKFEVTYPPVDPRTFYDRVRSGIADVAWITHGYTTGRFILTDIVQLPGNDGDAATLSRALWRIHAKYSAYQDEYQGIQPLSVFTHGPGMINLRKPVAAIAEFQGMKLRTGSNVQSEITKRLGAVPVSAPATKIHEFLSQGVTDGLFASIESITSLKLADAVKYHYSLPGGLYTASFAVVMNKAKFARLSPAHQAALSKVTGEFMAAHMGKTWDDADKLATAELLKSNNSITVLPPALAAEMRQKLADIEVDWLKRAKEAGLQDPQGVLREMREEIAKIKSGG